MRTLKIVSAIGLAALSLGAYAQTDFKALLNGTGLASKIKPADLPESFRACRLKVAGAAASGGGLGDMMSMMMIGMVGALGGAMGGSSSNAPPAFMGYLDVSWSDGTTQMVNGSEFLVTYGLDLNWMDLASADKSKPPVMELKLNLVRTSAINSFQPLTDLTKKAYVEAYEDMIKKAANPVQEGAATVAVEPGEASVAAAPADAKTENLSNLKQVALAMHLYASDYDDVIPWGQSSRTVHHVLEPYLRNVKVSQSLNPNGVGLYLFNMNLGGVSIGDIQDVAEIPMFFDPQPWPDGSRGVAYADGHARIVKPEDWPTVQEALARKHKRTARKPLPANLGG